MDKNQSNNILKIFPLMVYKTKIGLTEDERSILVKEVLNQEPKSQNPDFKKKVSAWTGDTQGFEFLYANKKFEKLFNLIGVNIKKYTETLGLNNDKIDFYYQRAWATISRGGENIAPHKHQQSHISFAYYLKKDKNDGALNFHDTSRYNEIVPGAFIPQTSKTFFTPNFYNAETIIFYPEEDDIYIFPSKSMHSTARNGTGKERISISADVSVIAKDSTNMEFVLTPVKKWLKF